MSGLIDSEASAVAWLVDGLGADAAAMDRLAKLVTMLTEENERLRALLYGQPEPSPLMQQVIEHRNNIGVWRNGNGVPINRTFSAALQPKEGE